MAVFPGASSQPGGYTGDSSSRTAIVAAQCSQQPETRIRPRNRASRVDALSFGASRAFWLFFGGAVAPQAASWLCWQEGKHTALALVSTPAKPCERSAEVTANGIGSGTAAAQRGPAAGGGGQGRGWPS